MIQHGRSIMSQGLFLGISTLCLLSPAAASDAPDLGVVEALTVSGGREEAALPPSVSLLSDDDLSIYRYSDINRVLRFIPGVNLQEEDGFGFRPNIGFRGAGPNRSSRMMILEDGVPVAPAPLSSPEVFYVPPVARAQAIEVTKGGRASKYGPVTGAGSLHFFSTAIPESASAEVTASLSDFDRTTLHAWAGDRRAFGKQGHEAGFLVETYQDEGSSFRELDIGDDAGFDVSDIVLKAGIFAPKAKRPQSLVLKYQSFDEDSDETYLGLAQSDFAEDPDRRYNATQLDRLQANRSLYQATHTITLSPKHDLTTVLYRTTYDRDWEKVDNFDNDLLSDQALCSTLPGVLANEVQCGGELRVLRGEPDFSSPDGVIGLRENRQEASALGIQSALRTYFDLGGIQHNVTASLRYHQDEDDRRESIDDYRMDNGRLVITNNRAPGTGRNLISNARSVAGYLEDSFRIGDLSVNAALRVENISTEQERWNSADRDRDPNATPENNQTAVLPSLGAIWDVTKSFQLLGGVSRGFVPTSPFIDEDSDIDPEELIAYEWGGRIKTNGFDLELVGFFNDYSNIAAECTRALGGGETCTIGDAQNVGEAEIWGLELDTGTDVGGLVSGLGRAIPLMPKRLKPGQWSIPMRAIYTYTSTELFDSFNSTLYGDVRPGDEIPYVPTHQLTMLASHHWKRWSLDGALVYVSETRDVPGQGEVNDETRIDARTTVDLSARYRLRDDINLFMRAENVFDEDYIASRRPYGVRPGKPREVFAGLNVSF